MINAPSTPEIVIDIETQKLYLKRAGGERCYTISSAKNGVGELNGSEQTPRGRHIIRAKIGAGVPINTVFSARRPTGEIYSKQLGEENPQRDWILTRILWLSGKEPGHNRLGKVDTMRRYIYIHGAPDENQMGVPTSHGCIKMANHDLIELFELVEVGTPVTIMEKTLCH
ncbi:MAG: L,D-transpeptidase [Gammaproteobacteria bacterium]|nr:L,D-transpeptidase [Gammaproteobacteria bacterium]